jgi:hypothetical protein
LSCMKAMMTFFLFHCKNNSLVHVRCQMTYLGFPPCCSPPGKSNVPR